MSSVIPIYLIMLVSSFLLAGCVTSANNSTGTMKTQAIAPENAIQIPQKALSVGNQIRLPQENSAGFESAEIQTKYHSALGQTCIQVQVITTKKIRLFCQVQDDFWLEKPLLASMQAGNDL